MLDVKTAHEVPVAAGGDVSGEPVRLEVAEEVDHRHGPARGERRAERRVVALASTNGSAACRTPRPLIPAKAPRMPPINTLTLVSSPA